MTPSSRPAPAAEPDHQLEIAIGLMLRIGVSLAASVILLGGILYLARGGNTPDYTHFHSAPAEALSIRGTFAGVLRGSSVSIIQFGVLLLIATPIARVLFALVGFAREHDRLYAWISAAVLAVLVFGLLYSR